jgi:hypothetical protein
VPDVNPVLDAAAREREKADLVHPRADAFPRPAGGFRIAPQVL